MNFILFKILNNLIQKKKSSVFFYRYQTIANSSSENSREFKNRIQTEKKVTQGIISSTMASLASPFQKVPGTFKFGDYSYEWRSLLDTPCYGFNGPNACYSSTCKHEGSKSRQHQPKIPQFIKPKSSSSMPKFSVKFNVRTVPGSANESDSSSTSSGDERMVNGIPVHVSSNMNGDSLSVNG